MKKRVISGILLLAIFIPIIFMGGTIYKIFMLLLSVAGFFELIHIREKKKEFPLAMRIFGFLLVLFLVWNNSFSKELTYVIDYRIMSFLLFSFLLPIIFINDSKKYNLNDALFLIGSVLFMGLTFNLLILLRNLSLNHIIYIFLITTITDTFAYIIGSLIGKHKMAPSISPNKTIEGFIGGVLMGVFVSSMFYYEVIDPNISMVTLIIVTVSLTMIGQLGDLVFSSIKRYYDVKDFSNLIPGHGGILDRLDSLVFVVLAFILYLETIL